MNAWETHLSACHRCSSEATLCPVGAILLDERAVAALEASEALVADLFRLYGNGVSLSH